MISPPQAAALLLATAAAASYVNHRFLRLPSTIGLMALALVASLALIGIDAYTPLDVRAATGFVSSIHFGDLLLEGMLPLLLFAGALNVDLRGMRRERVPIAILATVGVALSTAIAGALFLAAARLLGFELTLLQALLFGALIAPTDPVAVLGILRGGRVPKRLESIIAGESLFNDGVGIVLFLALLGAALGDAPLDAGHLATAFLVEGAGGLALGAGLGWAAARLLRHVDDYPLEVFMTLALASGGYAMASALGLSGPLATVGAGLVVGSFGRNIGMTDATQAQLDGFWTVVDEMLNAVLFMLVGLEMLVIAHDRAHVLLGLAAIPAVLLARWASVGAATFALHRWCPMPRGTLAVLTWGGLRGGISIALALSLPAGGVRDTLLTATYVVVVFSVLAQGLTLGRLARRVARAPAAEPK